MEKKQFGYNKGRFITKVISGGIEMVICFIAAGWLRSNLGIFTYGSLGKLSMALNVIGVIYFVWNLIYAYGYYQMNLEIGRTAIRGKGWDKELKVVPTMPLFFQVDIDDISRIENKNMLKIYTKEGKEYYMFLESQKEAYQELIQRFDEYDIL